MRYIFSLLIIIVAGNLIIARSQSVLNKSLETKVTRFTPTSGTIDHLLQQLADTYKIPIGIETLPEGVTPSKASVSIEQGSVRSALNEIVGSFHGYIWKEIDGVVNVFPKRPYQSILTTHLSRFRVIGKDRNYVVDTITDAPEVKTVMKKTGLTRLDIQEVTAWEKPRGVYPISLDLHRVTARRVLNETLKLSKSNYWIVARYGEKNEYVTIFMNGDQHKNWLIKTLD